MDSGARVFERLFPSVRRAERERFLYFFALATLLSLAQTLGLTGSEALFLSTLGSGALPSAFLVASLVTIAGSLGYASIVGRLRNDRLFERLLAGAGSVLALAWWLLAYDFPLVFVALFSGFYLFQTVLINLHFWTFVADFFDTLASKRVFPLFAVGGGLGGAIGGGMAWGLSQAGDTRSLIAGWAVALLVGSAFVRWGRSRFLRWGRVGVPELDESSMTGLREAWRFARRSQLARWLLASVVGMVFSLFLIQFLYMGIFERAFPSARELAAFFSLYLAVTNLVELVVGRGLTPWLIQRLGVGQANLLHPLLTLATFAVLAFDPRLHAAVFARFTRELLENALAGPIRALSYNALAERFRGRMRALLEGAVPYAGMFAAGATLWVIGRDVSLELLCGVGAGAALLYLAANLQVRREYLRSLVDDLGTGRLELEDVRAQLGAAELASIAEQWEELLAEEGRQPSPVVLQLAALLAQAGLMEPLRRTALTATPRARVAALDAMAEYRDPELARVAGQALEAESAEVRLAAARAATGLMRLPRDLRGKLAERLADPDPRVRAEAARGLDAEGRDTLVRMTASEEPEEAVSALERLPMAVWEAARARLGDPDPEVRAAALECVSRIGPASALSTQDLIEELSHSSARVRRAAARALADRPGAAVSLAGALDDVSRGVRDEAQTALSELGDAGLDAVRPLLRGSRTWTVDGALSAVAQVGGEEARRLLLQAYRRQVDEAWRATVAIDLLAGGDHAAARHLVAALDDARLRCRHLAFRALELLEDPAVVRSVSRALQRGEPALQASALEVLSHLADRETSQRLVTLLEDGPLPEKLSALSPRIPLPAHHTEVLQEAHRSNDRWVRLAAAGVSQPSTGTSVGAPSDATDEEMKIMERLLALRHVPLFQGLSLEQLEAIQRFMRDVQYIEGEIVMREGESGDELFVLLEGEVQVIKGYGTPDQTVLNTMTPVTYMGEIAILDAAPRSATIVVTRDARMLSLAGERFKELIRHAPEIAFEIFPVLTARLRAAEAAH